MKKFFIGFSILLFTLASCGMFTVDVKDFFDIHNPIYNEDEINTFTVTFRANNGTGTSLTQEFQAEIDQPLTLNTFSYLGHSFSSWSTAPDGIGMSYADGFNFKATENITLYAQWHPLTYTLSFDLNGGAGSAASQLVVFNQEIGSLPDNPTNGSQLFTGWSIDGTLLTINSVWTYPENKTAVALWDVATFTVTFNADGGLPEPAVRTVTQDSKLTVPTPPTKNGYLFDGWYTDSGLNDKWVFDTSTVTKDITLYAKWNERTEVWLNGSIGDGGDGTQIDPYNNFNSAKDTLLKGGTIWVSGLVTLDSGSHIWSSNSGNLLTIKRSGGDTPDKSDDFDGNFVLIENGASLTLQNITLDGQGGVDVDLNNDDKIDASDDFIGEGDVDALGALVYVGKNGTLNISTDAVLQNNESIVTGNGSAGAVYSVGSSTVKNSAIVTMNGGTIRYNSASNGGGILVKSGTTFTMSDGFIEYNISTDTGNGGGGGVHVAGANTVFNLNNVAAVIQYNDAKNGGGVFAYSSTFNLEKGSINNNTGQKGAGVSLYSDVTFNMANGSISNNTVTTTGGTDATGGGIYAADGSIITMTDGSIVNNIATNENNNAFGAGVYLTDAATIKLSDSPEIKDNEAGVAGSEEDNNLYFSNTSTTTSNVTIIGNIGGSSDSIGLSPKTVTNGHLLVQNMGNFTVAEDYFSMDDGAIVTHVDASGSIVAGDGAVPPVGTFTFEDDGTGNGYMLTSANASGLITEIVVPSMYNGKPVTIIASYAFQQSDLVTSVIIPNSVNTIGAYAFTNCTRLHSVTIPESVIVIGVSAFEGCNTLGTVYTNYTKNGGENQNPVGWQNYGNERLFSATWEPITSSSPDDFTVDVTGTQITGYNGTSKNVVIPMVIKGKTITGIADGAFVGNSAITSVTIPDSVSTIGQAFILCSSLTSITIPDSVTVISESAFALCDNLSVVRTNKIKSNYPSGWSTSDNGDFFNAEWLPIIMPEASFTFNKDAGEITGFIGTAANIVIPGTIEGVSVTGIGNSAFSGSGLRSIEIPNTVTNIGSSAFSSCSSLWSITIPNSVTNIGSSAFRNCDNLGSITIPSSVKTIESSAFYDSGLRSIEIPNSVISIGDSAFSNCGALTSVSIPESVTSIGNNVFQNTDQLQEILVDDTNTSYSSLDGILFSKDQTVLIRYPEGKSDEIYTIPNSVINIESSAFSDCSSLRILEIPGTVTNIGDSAFSGLINLFTVIINDGVTSIGNSSFQGCYSLSNVTIPDSVITIGFYAFDGCSALTSGTVYTNQTNPGSPSGWIPFGNDPFFNATWLPIP